MRLLRRLGRDDLAWPLRRLYVPVAAQDLVLEVGSGGNPFPRSNVLLDAYEVTRERHYQPLIADRPIVLVWSRTCLFAMMPRLRHRLSRA